MRYIIVLWYIEKKKKKDLGNKFKLENNINKIK